MQFFAIGIMQRYPQLDNDQLIEKALEYPEILVQDGFLTSIATVNPSLRQRILDFIVKLVTPTSDLSTTVQTLNSAVSEKLNVLDLVVQAQHENERLTPHETKRLLGFLVPFEDSQIILTLKNGLLNAIDEKEHRKQQRVDSSIEQEIPKVISGLPVTQESGTRNQTKRDKRVLEKIAP